MEADGEQAYELMSDIKAVDWLPLEAAVSRLSRAYERAFLTHVGPYALEAVASSQRSKAKAPAAKKRRSRTATSKRPVVEPVPAPPPQVAAVQPPPVPAAAYDVIEPEPAEMAEAESGEAAVTPDQEVETALSAHGDDAAPLAGVSTLEAASTPVRDAVAHDETAERRSFAQIVRNWLTRAA
jgi:8-oxo-dGTP diphosphatase